MKSGSLHKIAAILALALAMGAGAASAREGYRTAGTCDGYPRVALKTPPGLCVGLVAERLGFLRGLAAIGSDIYITDLASRTPGRGRVLRVPDSGRGAAQVVLTGLNQPNGIAVGKDGLIYVGEVGRVIRFDPRAANPQATIVPVLIGLPQDGRHNVTAFTIAPDGTLIVSVGSFSDNCEAANGRPPNPALRCPELSAQPPRGALLRVDPTGPLPIPAGSAQRVAIGIRNAMAFAFLEDGTLFVASNARDNIDSADPHLSDAALPHDVLLKIEQGGNYGWPYCFDANRPSPEYPRANCDAMRAPVLLLAPHAAPLGMIRYTGTRLKGLTGKLILAYHGYRALGHRIVALAVRAGGTPTGPEANVVAGWGFMDGVHPQGTPTALLQLADGSILVAEDHNRGLLRISTP